jgi:hypothetical protein
MTRTSTSLVVLALVVLAPAVAHANQMGGLAHLLVTWPIAVVLLLLGTVLGLIGRGHLRGDAHAHHGFGLLLLVLAGVMSLLFPAFTVWFDRVAHAQAPRRVLIATAVPVFAVGALVAYLGWRLL